MLIFVYTFPESSTVKFPYKLKTIRNRCASVVFCHRNASEDKIVLFIYVLDGSFFAKIDLTV